MGLPFVKMHGIGNDYVYIDTFDQPAPPDLPGLARRMSDRHAGVGSDGLILIGPSDRADARMRMFNADGSEGEMCGNGIRCVAKYLFDHDRVRRERLTVETGRGVLTLELEVRAGVARRVRVDMGTPILRSAEIPTTLAGDPPIDRELVVGGRRFAVTAVSTGNPHVVTYLDDVESFPVAEWGPRFEHSAAFPRRVNAHFVQVISRDEVRVRTWERGSGITLACGTGACAVCVAGVLTGRTNNRLLARLPGGELELEWQAEGASVFMTGPAEEVFTGVWPSGNGRGDS